MTNSIEGESHQPTSGEGQSGSQKEAEIKRVVERTEFVLHPEDFRRHYNEEATGNLLRREPKYREQLAAHLKDKRVIDLGCGRWESVGGGVIPEEILDLAIKMGASEYVGIDRYPINRVYPPHLSTKYRDTKTKITILGGEQGDMLTYLSTQPDNSANIMVNGLDNVIIDLGNPANLKYVELLGREIQRVIGKDHRVFGIVSEPIFDQLRVMGLKEDDFGGGPFAPEMFWNEE